MVCDRTCCRGGDAVGRAFEAAGGRKSSATQALHHMAVGSVILFFMALAALFAGA